MTTYYVILWKYAGRSCPCNRFTESIDINKDESAFSDVELFEKRADAEDAIRRTKFPALRHMFHIWELTI